MPKFMAVIRLIWLLTELFLMALGFIFWENESVTRLTFESILKKQRKKRRTNNKANAISYLQKLYKR